MESEETAPVHVKLGDKNTGDFHSCVKPHMYALADSLMQEMAEKL